jgi:hypothetical protein
LINTAILGWREALRMMKVASQTINPKPYTLYPSTCDSGMPEGTLDEKADPNLEP